MQHQKHTRTAALIFLLLLLLCLLVVLPIYSHIRSLSAESIESKADRGKDINILVMGIDARPGELNSRSDTMILVSLHPSINRAVLVWIPRDTRLYTPIKGDYKINSVNAFKGPEASCEVVGKLMDVDVDHYVLVNFKGFEKIIDILGGVDMEVDINLYSARSNVYLHKGKQHLNGKEALKYVRFRTMPAADIGRTARQQRFIKAVMAQVLQIDTITRLPHLLPEIMKHIYTNIRLHDLLFLTELAFLFDENNITTQTLPGYHLSDPKTGASYWEVDREIARSLIPSVLQGHSYEVDMEGWE